MGVDYGAATVQNLHHESGLADGTVVGILQHGGIVEHDERIVVGVDMEMVFDGFAVA